MKKELKLKSKQNKLTMDERKMEANKISSLQARIRKKVENKSRVSIIERNNMGLRNLFTIMREKLQPDQLKGILGELGARI